MKSPIELLCALLDDVRRQHNPVQGLDRDIITIKHRFEHESVGFLTYTLSVLSDAFDEGISTGRFTCPKNFKKVPRGALPRLFSGLLCKVFDRSTGIILSSPDLTMVKSIREILRLYKKLQPTTDQDIVLDRQAREKFLSAEEDIPSLHSDRLLHRLSVLSKYILLGLSNFDPTSISCKHGPGAVFEKHTPNQKWQGVLSYLERIVDYGYDIVGLNVNLASIGLPDDSLFFSTPARSIARLCTVPKNISSKRTITIEPCEQQFVQQGLNTELRKEISRCSVLSRCLALSDQSKNQHLAMVGSLTDEWATIDLSQASDLLSLRIVEHCFEARPEFLQALLGSRSAYISGLDRPLRKYAGMGNATTFPVQSIAFSLIAISGILGNRRITMREVRRASSCIRVYGDDIIIRREYAQAVVAELELAGLKINKSKSFLKGNFKESCGVDAYCGVDVTPLYVRYLSDGHLSTRAKELAHLVQLSNQAWLRGLYSMSTCIKEDVERRFKKLPYGPSEAGYLCWHTRLGHATHQRWDARLHRWLVRAPVVHTPKKEDALDGYAALLKFFHTPLLGRDVDHLKRTRVRHKLSVGWRWVPAA